MHGMLLSNRIVELRSEFQGTGRSASRSRQTSIPTSYRNSLHRQWRACMLHRHFKLRIDQIRKSIRTTKSSFLQNSRGKVL